MKRPMPLYVSTAGTSVEDVFQRIGICNRHAVGCWPRRRSLLPNHSEALLAARCRAPLLAPRLQTRFRVAGVSRRTWQRPRRFRVPDGLVSTWTRGRTAQTSMTIDFSSNLSEHFGGNCRCCRRRAELPRS